MSTSGNQKAQALYHAEQCESCGIRHGKLERHHIDGNTNNNVPTNIRIVCVRCHMTEDGRLNKLRERLKELQRLGAAARRKWIGSQCSVEVCQMPAKYRGLCNAHYYRARNNKWNPGDAPIRAYGKDRSCQPR